MRMKQNLVVVSCLLAASWAGASVCDQAYHFQSAYQVILTGTTTTANIKQDSRAVLDKSLGGATLLAPETEYQIVTDFSGGTGACKTWTAGPIDYALRKPGETKFGKTRVDSLLIMLQAGDYPGIPLGLEYWFGFASGVVNNQATVVEVVGKAKTSKLMHLWYGNATMKKEIKNSLGSVISTQTFFYRKLFSYPDSAGLQKNVMKEWSNEVNNATQNVSFTLQLIKVLYDSVASPQGITGGKVRSPGFKATQNGQLVFIQTGDKNANLTEAVCLFNMLGLKIATLHPTGYLYQWNGRTSTGADAPMGVYFVQSGSRVLGKFFYSR